MRRTLLDPVLASPTMQGNVWPLALMVQGLTAHNATERAGLLRTLLKLQCGNGLMHESGGWQRAACMAHELRLLRC